MDFKGMYQYYINAAASQDTCCFASRRVADLANLTNTWALKPKGDVIFAGWISKPADKRAYGSLLAREIKFMY